MNSASKQFQRSTIAKHLQLKIVCIGLPKTGTTSLGDALEYLGFKRLGWQPKISGPLTVQWHEQNIDRLFEFVYQYDAFEDVPWCQVYREIDAQFPNAKFIVTHRLSSERWLDSIQRHIKRIGRWVGNYWIFGSYDPVQDPQLYIEKYESHLDEVRDYFAGRPEKLLTLCFENGDGWKELTRFLGVEPVPNVSFPHTNKDLQKWRE